MSPLAFLFRFFFHYQIGCSPCHFVCKKENIPLSSEEAENSPNSPPEPNLHLSQTDDHGQDDTIDRTNNQEDHQYSNRTTLNKLNSDCLGVIARHITYFGDLVAFSEVCPLFRNVCSNIEWDKGPIPPCLMLSNRPGSDARPFFSLFNKKVSELKLEAATARRSFGSPHGWLATIDDEALRPQLLNPISQVCIDLPPFAAILNQPAIGNQLHMVAKLFVFRIEICPIKLLVMAISRSEDQLLFTNSPGDFGGWRVVSNPMRFKYKSVAYHKQETYALCGDGSLKRIDTNAATAESVAEKPKREYVGRSEPREQTGRAYLVSSQDDLFGVFRYSTKDYKHENTLQFLVYKFDFESKEWEPEPEQSIGDKAFFVGNGNSWSISSADTVNCRSNHIYYGDDADDESAFDYGFYDLANSQKEVIFMRIPEPHAPWIALCLIP